MTYHKSDFIKVIYRQHNVDIKFTILYLVFPIKIKIENIENIYK